MYMPFAPFQTKYLDWPLILFLALKRRTAVGLAERKLRTPLLNSEWMQFFAYSWKLPAYSGAFLLTIDNLSFFTYNLSCFALNFSFLTYSWSFFAYSGKVLLIRALRDCKQRSLTVSKKAPTVSKEASPILKSLVRDIKERLKIWTPC